ncbi:Yippee/Mis18 [Desarmillaria tabescens]|uniref:Protein yippee-like n=1 Tax=Armillaria tabescens TaxID=1929756 RepID=A0AA39TST1_ARMTA|nr:Yippee/Mis18 [Desarmillaria tabescens]KAK0465313.1 Yippee/Mis18 [Desarmillaria tabescens]
MGMSYRRYLAGERIYGCSTCKTHLATIHSMISRAFNGQHGRAYLFDGVYVLPIVLSAPSRLTLFCSSVNVVEGEPNDRTMTTGAHTVRDIYCCKCSTCLGWKYDKAYEPSQKYKEGKYILERNLLTDVQ